MALEFRDNGDRIDCGTASDDSQETAWMWLKPFASANQARQIAIEDAGNPGANAESFSLDSLNPRLEIRKSGNNANYEGSTALSTGTWYFIAYTLDEAATPTIHIYTGTLTALCTEITYDGAETDGDGTWDTRDGTFRIGNRFGTTDRNGESDIAIVGFIEGSILTLGQLQSLQFRPRVVTGTQRYFHLGFNGNLGTVADWSGNGNNGSPTGTVVVPHVPLGPPFGFDELLVSTVDAAAITVPALDEGALVGGLQPLAGGLE